MIAKPVTARLAPRIARRMAPTLIQQVDSVRDFIAPIHEGAMDLRYMDQPALYYHVTHDKDYYYALYAVFHRKDYSTLPWPIKLLDEHEFDLEGVLIARHKGLTDVGWVASIFHREILFDLGTPVCPQFWVELGGHGIIPDRKARAGKTGDLRGNMNEFRYRFDHRGHLVQIERSVWERVYQPVFNPHGVNMPWQWECKHLGEESRGLIYHDPAKLLELAKTRGRI